MKILITENRLRDAQLKWLNDNYGDCVPKRFKNEKLKDYIPYAKDGEIIFNYNKKTENVGIDSLKIWSFFENMFNMKYEQIQALTKHWLEEQYKLKVNRTECGGTGQYYYLEEQYKLNGDMKIIITENRLHDIIVKKINIDLANTKIFRPKYSHHTANNETWIIDPEKKYWFIRYDAYSEQIIYRYDFFKEYSKFFSIYKTQLEAILKEWTMNILNIEENNALMMLPSELHRSTAIEHILADSGSR